MPLLFLLPLLFLPVFLVIAGLLVLKWLDRRDARRLPFDAKKLVNQPGANIRMRLDDASYAVWSVAAVALFAGPVIPLIVLVTEVGRASPELLNVGMRAALLYFVTVVAGVALLLHQARRHILTLRRCREGLAAECSTAEGLQQLVPEGLLVFHDLPAEGFNIDHVVVGPGVVFAIETKSRKKPAATGKASARVRYDDKALHFPDHVDTKCLKQAAGQARWLVEFLSGATGNPVRVIPVLALPGWFVEQSVSLPLSGNDVRVINPKNPAFMHKLNFGSVMADDQRRRIAWALTKRYGDAAAD